MVESTALLLDSMEKLPYFQGDDTVYRQIEDILSKGSGLYVTPKDIDLSLKILCPIISRAIDKAAKADRKNEQDGNKPQTASDLA